MNKLSTTSDHIATNCCGQCMDRTAVVEKVRDLESRLAYITELYKILLKETRE